MKRILTFTMVLLLIVLFSNNIANAKIVRFAQVTDLHYKNTSPALIKIINDINKSSDISFVVFTGDCIGRANPQNFSNFLNDVKKLKKPYYLVLGDRDVSKSNHLDKATYVKMARKVVRTMPKQTNYVFKRDKIVFIVVDGSKELVSGLSGAYLKDTINWVDKQLTKYQYNKVVILQHFPIANKPSNDFYYTYNAMEYIQMLGKHNNVIAVVTGHFHYNDEITYNGVYHITSPRASDGVYKIIDIDTDNNYEIYTILKRVK